MLKIGEFLFGKWGGLAVAAGGLLSLVVAWQVERTVYGSTRELAGVRKERAASTTKALENVEKARNARTLSGTRNADGLRASPYVR